MRTLFSFLILAAAWTAYSQDKEYRTIFDQRDMRISGLGGPFMQFTSVAGEFGHMMGGGAAVLLNDFFIGGYGLGLTNAIPDYVNDHSNDKLSLGHGGFWIGYSLFGEKPIHACISTLVGWGEFGIMGYDGYYPFIRDKIFTLAPVVELELNLTRYFRIGAGATYNIYTGLDEQRHGYSSENLSSPGGFLSFKFGWF
ncbi:MAG TPA: hypothetical protein ENO20_07585 [Bacteroides sp.]|nr:hypothetical protein [Bacteroides sp.]